MDKVIGKSKTAAGREEGPDRIEDWDFHREEAQGFEVTEYAPPEGLDEDPDPGGAKRLAVIKEIVQYMNRGLPTHGFYVRAGSGRIQLVFAAYEMQAPRRMKEIVDNAKQALNEAVKYIKKEYKLRTGKVLTLKEKKDEANFSIEKVSLNERYMYTTWRVYELE